MAYRRSSRLHAKKLKCLQAPLMAEKTLRISGEKYERTAKPRKDRPLDLDDWSNRRIYHETPATEKEKMDLDGWSNQRICHGTTTQPSNDDWSNHEFIMEQLLILSSSVMICRATRIYHGTTTEPKSERSSVADSETNQQKMVNSPRISTRGLMFLS
ncbi:hypothetical protein POTOM_015893 [Populus tomentosa]|uniref:Uncharacterized protein n=1 Tax=Populus tomentosa TaxID=118781 RepID=A0A8X8A0Q6_POPTO|nr:hypothetical protein POTOM_015893 [Populus tomentosa]